MPRTVVVCHACFAGVHRAAVEVKRHIVKIRVVDAHRHLEIVGILVARRIVAHGLAVHGALHLAAVLADVQITAGRLRKIEDIGVAGRKVTAPVHREFARAVVDIELGAALAEGARAVERRRLCLIFFTVGKLLFYLLHRGMTAFVEPRRKLFGAVLAEIAVLELAVAEQADFVAANVAIFFIKKSHEVPPNAFYLSSAQMNS